MFILLHFILKPCSIYEHERNACCVSFAPSADVMIAPAFGSFLLVFKHGVKVTHRFLFICSFFFFKYKTQVTTVVFFFITS